MDMDNPPEDKIFNPKAAVNTMDLSTLAKRRAAQLQPAPPDPVQPAVQVAQAIMNPVLELLRDYRGAFIPQAVPIGASAQPCMVTPTAAAVTSSTLLEPMDLDDFSMLFGLSSALKEKLLRADITGPHILRLISDDDLRKHGLLSIGELAALRDAEERWKVRQAVIS